MTFTLLSHHFHILLLFPDMNYFVVSLFIGKKDEMFLRGS